MSMTAVATEKAPNTMRAIDAFKKHAPAGVEKATCRYTDLSKENVEVVLRYADGSIQSGMVYLMAKNAYLLNIHTTYSPMQGWSHPHHRHTGQI